MIEEKLKKCKKDILESNAFIEQYKKELMEASTRLKNCELLLENLSHYKKTVRKEQLKFAALGLFSSLIGSTVFKVTSILHNAFLGETSEILHELTTIRFWILSMISAGYIYYHLETNGMNANENDQKWIFLSKKEQQKQKRQLEQLIRQEEKNIEFLNLWIKEEEEKIKNLALEILNTEIYHNELYIMNVKEEVTENNVEPESIKNEKVKSKQLIR